MRLVVALGGNALLQRGEQPLVETQRARVDLAARAIAAISPGNEVLVTHGNGPQVGLLAMESYASAGDAAPPLDVLGAESQGLVGYLVETALRNALPGREIVTVLGQVLVDAADPSFSHPVKPIGPMLDARAAGELQRTRGWVFAPEGAGLRRVVPSPEPVAALEVEPLRQLLSAGVIVISGGGGGVPVVRDADGRYTGVEAVVDKDLTASLLARELGAGALVLLTDVDAVWHGWGSPDARRIRSASPGELRALSFAPGSMGPKVEAACRFVEATGAPARIGALDQLPGILGGSAGTLVEPGSGPITFW